MSSPNLNQSLRFVELLKKAPAEQLDQRCVPIMKSWDSPPKASQVFSLLKDCKSKKLSASFLAIQSLQALFELRLEDEHRFIEEFE